MAPEGGARSLQGIEGQLVDRNGLALQEVGNVRFAVERGALVAQKGGNFAFHLVKRRRACLAHILEQDKMEPGPAFNRSGNLTLGESGHRGADFRE